MALPKAPPSSQRAIPGSTGCGSCACLLRRQRARLPKHAAADPGPGRDGHWGGRLTAGTAGLVPEWLLSAMCWWHSLPFSRSGGSPELPDCGLRPQHFCSVPTAGGNDGSLVNSLLQKRIWINSKRPLPLRFSKITDQARTPFPYSPAYWLPSYFLCLSGQVAHLFVFSHFIFLTMISSLNSAKHLHSDSQTIYLELSGTRVNQDTDLCGIPADKGKGLPCSFFKASV